MVIFLLFSFFGNVVWSTVPVLIRRHFFRVGMRKYMVKRGIDEKEASTLLNRHVEYGASYLSLIVSLSLCLSLSIYVSRSFSFSLSLSRCSLFGKRNIDPKMGRKSTRMELFFCAFFSFSSHVDFFLVLCSTGINR